MSNQINVETEVTSKHKGHLFDQMRDFSHLCHFQVFVFRLPKYNMEMANIIS